MLSNFFPKVITFLLVVILTLGYKYSIWSEFALVVVIPFVLLEWKYCHKGLRLDINRKILWGFIVFSILIILAGSINKDWPSVRKAYKYITYAAPFFICAYLVQKFDVERSFRGAVVFSLLILNGYGLYQWHILHLPRITSIFETPNALGMALELLVPFSIAYCFIERKHWLKSVWVIITITSLVCIYLTGSRGSALGLFSGIFATSVIFLVRYKDMLTVKQKAISIVLSLAILFAGSFMVFGINSYRDNASGGERTIMLESSYRMWKDHKLSGIGMAHWKENYYGPYRPENQHEANLTMPHNMLIYYMSTTGIIGTIGYGGYIVLTLVGLIQLIKKDKRLNYVRAAGLVIFAGYIMVHGLVDGTIINTNISKIYYLMLGYAISSGVYTTRLKI